MLNQEIFRNKFIFQLARDGNHQLLALALDRLGNQCQRRINQLDDQKLAPLHYAARYSHPYTILTLLQRKARVNIRGQYGITPLHCAARYLLKNAIVLTNFCNFKRSFEMNILGAKFR